MGLIKAALGSFNGAMADQWKEFFTCEALDKNTLVVKGQKQTGKRSSNTRGSDNVITNGSGISVADGQCMIIVEQGKVVEICAEPGVFTYNSSLTPSVFVGDFGEGLKASFNDMKNRFVHGGATGRDQRIYYFNTKEIIDNMFGTPNPVPFRVVDRNIGLDIDVSIRCSGVYSYKITDPILFYTNVCGNIESVYTKDEIASQLKAEFVSALQPAFASMSELQLRPNAIPAHTIELSDSMNAILTKKWAELRGISIVSIAINNLNLPPEDAEMIKQAQRTGMMRDTNMAAATLVGAQADAMKSAASNPNGAMNGFIGMGMAQQAGGANAQNLFAMGQTQPRAGTPFPAPNWSCACGTQNTGKFCMNCGSPKPSDEGWTCSCGTVNKGKFCAECGKPKPANAPLYQCDKSKRYIPLQKCYKDKKTDR